MAAAARYSLQGPGPHQGASTLWVAPPTNQGWGLPGPHGPRSGASCLEVLMLRSHFPASWWDFCSHVPSTLSTFLSPSQSLASSTSDTSQQES